MLFFQYRVRRWSRVDAHSGFRPAPSQAAHCVAFDAEPAAMMAALAAANLPSRTLRCNELLLEGGWEFMAIMGVTIHLVRRHA